MSRAVAYDLTRLFTGPLFSTPRGIDRVDLALAEYIFADPVAPHLGILPTPWGVRAFSGPVVRRALAHLKKLWAEDVQGADDPTLAGLIAQLTKPEDTSAIADRRSPSLSGSMRARRFFEHLNATGIQLGRAAERAVPRGAAYLNVGQIGLAVPMFHYWLERRPDVTCTIMLHDAIPLEYPHLVVPSSVNHHARMIQTASRHADSLLFTTTFARESVNSALSRLGRVNVPSFVRSLPLPAAYVAVERCIPQLEDVHYFVAVSTIEPRKNYELLFRTWERLIARGSASAPHLVIVGSPGYDSRRILGMLECHPLLRSRIHHVSGLSSSGLAALVLGAAGMLSPSLAEGFGLPVLEANAMGVPTIASDIAAHREIADNNTVLLAPDDIDGWERAILAVPRVRQRRRPLIPERLTEAAYCADVFAFLSETPLS